MCVLSFRVVRLSLLCFALFKCLQAEFVCYKNKPAAVCFPFFIFIAKPSLFLCPPLPAPWRHLGAVSQQGGEGGGEGAPGGGKGECLDMILQAPSASLF